MKLTEIVDAKGILTEKALQELKTKGRSVSCECPAHLIEILKSIKDFTQYQEKCVTEKPADKLTHEWLKATSLTLEHLVSSTIVNLARLEGMIDEENKIQDE